MKILGNRSVGSVLFAEQFVTFAPDIGQLHIGVLSQIFAQLGNEYVHRAGVEEVVVSPEFLEDKRSFDQLAHVFAEDQQKLGFPGGELAALPFEGQRTLAEIKT